MKKWNPHSYLVSAARRVWRWCPEKREAATKCAVGSARRKCTSCEKVFPKKQVHIDHIEPVGKQPREWDEYPNFYRRLFCPPTNLQGLCITCHAQKTSVQRRANAKSAN